MVWIEKLHNWSNCTRLDSKNDMHGCTPYAAPVTHLNFWEKSGPGRRFLENFDLQNWLLLPFSVYIAWRSLLYIQKILFLSCGNPFLFSGLTLLISGVLIIDMSKKSSASCLTTWDVRCTHVREWASKIWPMSFRSIRIKRPWILLIWMRWLQ